MHLFQQLFGYILIGFIFLTLLSICYLPFYFLFRRHFPFWRQAAGFLFGAWVLVVCFVTVLGCAISNIQSFGTVFTSYHRINLIPFRFITEPKVGDVDLFGQGIANILIFVPLGFLAPVALPRLRRFWKTSLSMALFSLSIELTQYFIGRCTDIDDLLLNTLGGIGGYCLFRLFSKLLRRQKWWCCFCGTTIFVPPIASLFLFHSCASGLLFIPFVVE